MMNPSTQTQARPDRPGHWQSWAWACLVLAMTLPMLGCEAPNPVLRKHGIDAYNDGDFDRSKAKFTRVVERQSADWKAHYYLGLIALQEDQPLQAQLSLERSLSIRADHDQTPDILDALAQSLLRQRKYENLTAMLQQATDRYGQPKDYLRQAIYLGKAGDVDGAKVAFQKAIRFWPAHDPEPFLAQASFYESIGAGTDALHALRQAYYLAPDDPHIAERIRRHGMVPGPTVAIEPER